MLLYGIFVIIQVAYADNPNTQTSQYIPKSKRGKPWQCTARLKTWANKQANKVADSISKWDTANRSRKKIETVTRIATRIGNPGRSNRNIAFLAFAAVAMQANGGLDDNQTAFDTDSAPIGIDNRCTGCISNRIEDFEGPLQKSNRVIKGFGGTRTRNVMIGTIVWRWNDDQGKHHKFVIPKSFYVAEGNVRLLSPQHWAQTQNDKKPIQGTGSETLDNKVTLFWKQRKCKLTVPLGRADNVATFTMADGFRSFAAFCAEAEVDYKIEQQDPIICSPAQMISDDEYSDDEVEQEEPKKGITRQQSRSSSNENDASEWPNTVEFDLDGPTGKNRPIIVEDEEDIQPTNLAAEMLRYHHKFGHVSFARLQEMAKLGIIPKRLAKCPVPTCSACLYAKAIRRKWRGKTANNSDEATKPSKPGECVSVDQLKSPTPGLIAQLSGFLTTKRYGYATVYIDHASRVSFVYLQKSTTAEETLEGKRAFEQYAKDRGVTIHAYHADNGIFRAHKWVEACRMKGQSLTFAGVNAHHQNGMAERRIRTLQEHARTMLIHANRRWPKCITANLWPYAMRMANDVLNETPNMLDKQRRTSQQIFANTKAMPNPKHWKPFGCPVYVLDSRLQGSGGIFHKWKERSKVGIYLGRSPQHARSVALVLSRETALVSPQFHVGFDPSFHTVKQGDFDSRWQTKAGFVAQREPTNKKRAAPNETVPRKAMPRQVHWNAPPEGAATAPDPKRQRRELSTDRGKGSSQTGITNMLQHPATTTASHEARTPQPPEEETAQNEQERRRSSRTPQPVERLIDAMLVEIKDVTKHDVEGEIFCLEAMFPSREEIEHPLMAYKATSDPDTMYLHEAMKEPDKDEFIRAMDKEVKDQIDNGNFTIIPRSSVPKGEKILPTVWQMKRKRDIRTREIKKYKARLNIDGSRMEKGIHYWDTYAPVASWNSIRLLLAMTALHNWNTTQLDFVLAFPQAPVERVLFMSIPKGFDVEGGQTINYVLQLHKNVYGQKQAGRVWNKYLVKKLTTELKFEQSKVDECIFYRGKTMYALYTDDSILAGPDQAEIDQIIKEMKQVKLDITVEGDLQDFLGVHIERMPDGTIQLTQPHLIDQILDDLRLNDDNVAEKTIPATSSKLLSRHSDSEPFDNSFNYRSVIGKLNYLEKSTRSDIAYITHQLARFSAEPKKEHGQALRWLGRYLKATRTRGTILRIDESKDLELFVDADFSGNWDPKESQDRDTARSRHGYILMYAGCAVLWKSQMQTEIALSSTESEYTGLSYGLRDTIPIMELLKELKKKKFPIRSTVPNVHCKVFEDNSGALEMATVHKSRPRTKHLNVKLHHFRDYVTRKEISINPIDTSMQLADYLTKAVNWLTLSRLRPLVMGW